MDTRPLGGDAHMLRFASLLCCWMTFALPACSTNAAVSAGSTVLDFAHGLDGKTYRFDLSGSALAPGLSGALEGAQRIPKGLLVALEPAQQHCAKAGGESSYPKFQAAGAAQLPLRMLCQRAGAPLWSLELTYADVGVAPRAEDKRSQDLVMTLHTELLVADQVTSRMRDEDEAPAKAAAAERERQAAIERARQQEADAVESERQAAIEQSRRQQRTKKDKDAASKREAQRVASQWPARVADFRAHLKPGDRFKWASSPKGVRGGPFVGTVVRVEFEMAFVQFDNLTIGGQPTRYIPKQQLEPFDGPTPSGRSEIK